MKVYAYGEDALTLWAIKNRLSEILGKLGDETKVDNSKIFFRPSFGRGGKGTSNFGEFDFIILAKEKLYLGESKWDGAKKSNNKVNIKLKKEQLLRHEIFKWYLNNWAFSKHESWENLVTASESTGSEFPKVKQSEKKKKDMQELEESLTKLIEKHIPEHITKAKLMEMLEGSTKSAPAPTKVPTVKPGEKVKQPGKKNPFKIEPSQKPNPKAEMTEAGVGAPAPTKAPVKTPTKTPSKAPGKKNPFKIEPSQKPNPKAKGPKWLSYNTFTSMGYNLK